MEASLNSYLVYSICATRPAAPPAVLAGVDRQPVYLIESHGLAAAVSLHPGGPSSLAPDTTRTLAYGRVVEALHRQDTVLPLRYGCIMNDQRRVTELLDSRAGEYRSALQALHGCVEMGLRILLDPSDPAPIRPRPPAVSAGTDYLLARKRHYEEDERARQNASDACEKYRSTFSRFIVECWGERSPSTGSVGGASLYLLVNRDNLEPLRQAFRDLCRVDPTRLLLTGPWPPYSFAERPRK